MSLTITAVKLQKRNRQRVNVYLNGEYAFALNKMTAAWLQVGQELSEEKIDELKSQDVLETAYQRALGLLAHRPRSEAEIQRKLEYHAFTPEVITQIMNRLREAGLVDDEHFAREWVDNRMAFRPRSRRALEVELRQRGVNLKTIAQALEELDDTQAAYQAALKVHRKYENLDWMEYRNKLSAYLARRGFNYETIRETIQKMREENQSGIQSEYES